MTSYVKDSPDGVTPRCGRVPGGFPPGTHADRLWFGGARGVSAHCGVHEAVAPATVPVPWNPKLVCCPLPRVPL
jgi:hypothetical protein